MHTIYRALLLLALSALLTACSDNTPNTGSQAKPRSLEEIKTSGELRILTRNAPTIYYLNRDNEASGADYELIRAFADSLGVTPRLITEDTVGDILGELARGKGDIAAAGLSVTAARRDRFLFSSPTEEVTEQLVCRRGGNVAKTPEQLPNVSLEVAADSSYEETLSTLQEDLPTLSWKRNTASGTELLLQKVWEGKVDCTVADSNIVAVNRRFMPELIVMFDLDKPRPQAWVMPEAATDLRSAANQWLASKDGRVTRARVHDRHYSFIDNFDYVDTRALIRRIDDRLPNYDSLFERAAREHNLNDALLAAQAYQESHWDATAKSPTGVRGIMMLTRNTAKSLGVEDRLDPKQAIPAGALYLAKMRERFDGSIPEPDRTYLALAAYNIGRAHMHDAQTLARKLGKDPHKWSDIREVLPLLSDKRYYKDLKYGYAHGLEPVRYVQRIRNYQDIIAEKTN